MGSDKGAYFIDQLNLKELEVQGASYDFITRLIPLGAKNLDITSVNAGLDYVDNHQYSSKIITGYWRTKQYTDPQALKDDAVFRLIKYSQPVIAYNAKVIDLANSNPNNYGLLDYDLGDTVTLIDEVKGIKSKVRIVKTTEYLLAPETNEVQIANRLQILQDMQIDFMDAADSVNAVTNGGGSTIDGGAVDSIDVSQLANIQNLHIVVAQIDDLTANYATIATLNSNYATITTLNASNARIGTLETTTATITQLNATNVNVTNLTASKANVVDLTVSTGRITTLESQTASINTILAGNVGAGNLAAGAIQAGSAVIGNGAISSAQMISLDVLKLIAGNISTNKFTVQSDNGNLKILGDTIKLWDGLGHERISLGLNSGDYNLLVRGSDGVTLMFGVTGVTNAGIIAGAVDDSKINVSANINGSKIEKESLVSQVNGATTLILASQIRLNTANQTLEIAFNSLSTTVTTNGTTTTSQGTSIVSLQGTIVLKANQTSLDTTNIAATALTTRVSTAEGSISVLQSSITLKVATTDFTSYQTATASNFTTTNGNVTTAQTQANLGVTNAATANGTANTLRDTTVPALTTRVSSAETKITPAAITSTVTTSSQYISDLGAKITSAQASTISQTASNVQIGFNGISSNVVIAATGLTVNGGALTVKNAAGTTVFNVDAGGNGNFNGYISLGTGGSRIYTATDGLHFANNGFDHNLRPQDFPPKVYASSSISELGVITQYSSPIGDNIYSKIWTGWFSLYFSLVANSYGAADGVLLTNGSDFDSMLITGMFCNSYATEVLMSCVGWGISSGRINTLNFRARTFGTAYTGTLKVCVTVIGIR